MKKQRGRPKTLLARMSDETRDEICNAINYGSRAWRMIRILQLLSERRRQLLSEGKGLRPDYLSAGWAAMLAQNEARAAGAQRWRAKIKGRKRLAPEKYLKLLNQFCAASFKTSRPSYAACLLLRPPPRPEPWAEAAFLWRELLQQFETALAIGDDDWLNDLAKAIRGEAQPEQYPEFTTKVLEALSSFEFRASTADWPTSWAKADRALLKSTYLSERG